MRRTRSIISLRNLISIKNLIIIRLSQRIGIPRSKRQRPLQLPLQTDERPGRERGDLTVLAED